MKIIEGVMHYTIDDVCYFLYGNYSSYAIKLRENCSAKNDIFIGDRWVVSWKPLGFEGNILYG